MLPSFSLILAFFIFLTSATAVIIHGIRLSDVAALFLPLILFFTNSNKGRITSNLIFTMLILLGATLTSSAVQLINANDEVIQAGLPNALAITFNIIVAILFLHRCSKKITAEVMAHYSRIALSTCWIIYIWQLIYGHPNWIDIGDVPERFSALSKNPNQLALFLLPIPFFSAYCYQIKLIKKKSAIFYATAAVLLNTLAMGKALFIAWIFGLIFIILTGGSVLGGKKITFSFLATRVTLLGFGILALLPLFDLLYTGNTIGGQEDQGQIRLALWINGLLAWLDAIFIGHGPGHYGGLEAPYGGMESHNFFIDWVSAYGLAGLSLLSAVFLIIILTVWRSSNAIIFAFLITLIVQIFFHFYARQPAFWIWWIFAFTITSKNHLNNSQLQK